MKNYSRQREAILNLLRSTDTHPTADWIYRKVKEQIPNISLGTVYRNISELSSLGEILSINIGDGKEHFDGNNMPHLHLSCRCCGNIADARLNYNPISAVADDYGFIPDTQVYVVYGICQKCNQNNKFGGN